MKDKIYNGDIKSIITEMVMKSPLDLLFKKGILLRERHLNVLLKDLKFLVRPKVKVMEDYIAFNGIYNHPLFMLIFNQKVFLSELISDKTIRLHMTNDNLNKHNNSIKINLSNMNELIRFLDIQKNVNILNELTLDNINIKSGSISLSSTDKIDIAIKEDFINHIIEEELTGKFGIKMLHIRLEDGYINATGTIVLPEFEVSFNKNIRVIDVDLYHNKYIEIEFDEQNFVHDKVAIAIHIDRIKGINKAMDNQLYKQLIDKILFHKNIHMKIDKEEEGIIFTHK